MKKLFRNIVETIKIFFNAISIYIQSFINRYIKRQVITDKGLRAITFINEYLFTPLEKEDFTYSQLLIYNELVDFYTDLKEKTTFPITFKQYLIEQALVLLKRTPPNTNIEINFEMNPYYEKDIPEP